jgi:hypothetical protein
MAYVSAFFESVAGDRLYTANRWAQIFNAIQTQGYIPDYESEMLVVESSPAAMTTRISPGAGFVEGRYIEITSYETITHAAAHATLHRKDLVILRLDLNTGVRDLFPTVLQGANAATAGAAVVPTLTQNSTIYEVALAEVHIPPLDTAIQNAQITDRRATLWGRASYPDLTEHKALTTLDHPDGSVTNAKIAANTIQGDSKIAPSTITGNAGGSAIGADSIHANRLVASMSAAEFDRITLGGAVVDTQHIIDAKVTNAKLQAGAVTDDKILNDTINLTAKAADGSLTGDKVAANTIDGDDKLIAGSVTGNAAGSAIGTDSIHANRLSASLTPSEFARVTAGAAVVVAGNIAAGAVTVDKLTVIPVVHGENTTPTALTTGTPTMLTINTPTAGRYLVHLSVAMSSVDSSTGDNGQALQAYILDGSGQVGPTLQAYVHTFSPAQNQTHILNFTYNIVQTAAEPLSVIARKAGGSGNSQFLWTYIDAEWVAAS